MTLSSKLLLKELDEAVLRGSAESRERALWYATDMLMVGSYAEDEIWIFGDVAGPILEQCDRLDAKTRSRTLERVVSRIFWQSQNGNRFPLT